MIDGLQAIQVAAAVRAYVKKEGKTLMLSQGKMLKDAEMPDDLKDFLKTG